MDEVAGTGCDNQGIEGENCAIGEIYLLGDGVHILH